MTDTAKPPVRSLYERVVAAYMLLDRRRTWPGALHATDLDHIVGMNPELPVLEYHQYTTCALVDYKWRRLGYEARIDSSAIRMQRTLALRANLPFFICQYLETDWSMRWMRVETMGANVWVDGTETDWVRLLMGLRHRALPDDWAPAPIRNRPLTFDAIADAVIRDGGDPLTVARYLTKLQKEFS